MQYSGIPCCSTYITSSFFTFLEIQEAIIAISCSFPINSLIKVVLSSSSEQQESAILIVSPMAAISSSGFLLRPYVLKSCNFCVKLWRIQRGFYINKKLINKFFFNQFFCHSGVVAICMNSN